MKAIVIEEEQFDRLIELALLKIKESMAQAKNTTIDEIDRSISFRTVNFHIRTMQNDMKKS